LAQGVAVRTLQRFLESIRWDEEGLRDRCQQLVATEHSDPEAIGVLDETGTTKSGRETAGVKRQYNGNRGKVENCINTVALSYASTDFHCLLDARLYLPQEWVPFAGGRSTYSHTARRFPHWSIACDRHRRVEASTRSTSRAARRGIVREKLSRDGRSSIIVATGAS
jgi:hypothetical protein